MGVAAANSVFAVIDKDKEVNTGVLELDKVKGNIKFEQVHFAYSSNNDIVLNEINLEVNPCTTVALVGPSGSGKSTLVSLLLGFYRPDTGQILLDDHDLVNVTLESLRDQIAIVTQDTMLFDNTIRSNIVYGSPKKSDDALQRCIEAAFVSEFVDRLPDGLETNVGERGTKLSGGQRQRVAIARALYKDAPILILDEATTSLDSVSERLVQSATENLAKDRTTIIIAHRLSTVEKADQIYVMDRGRIVEVGRHNDLLEKKGLYETLYKSQQIEH